MPDSNGNSPLDKMQETLRLLLSNVKNWEEHEHIWQAVNALRVNTLELTLSVAGLTGAIRELIHRIPPENLK
jgi:hypothetical protein